MAAKPPVHPYASKPAVEIVDSRTSGVADGLTEIPPNREALRFEVDSSTEVSKDAIGAAFPSARIPGKANTFLCRLTKTGGMPEDFKACRRSDSD